MRTVFDHENLRVYQASIKFVAWAANLLERVPGKLSVWDQIDRASISIPLNIAEGNGRFTPSDRCRFFDISRGSAFGCAASLDVLVAKKVDLAAEILDGKELLYGVVSMLVGLIRNNSPIRMHEEPVPCRTSETTRRNSNPKSYAFDHENLRVYQESLKFVEWLTENFDRIGNNVSLRNRLDRASTAIPLNIAEGNGKYMALDRCRFFDNARGSALHCAAGLDLLATKASSALPTIGGGKAILRSIVSMLVKLTESNLGEGEQMKRKGYGEAKYPRRPKADYD
jgi:four helix bundle protein